MKFAGGAGLEIAEANATNHHLLRAVYLQVVKLVVLILTSQAITKKIVIDFIK